MPTEIAAARTANSNTTQNPDGSLTTRFGTGLNTQASPGVWVPASFGFTASGTDLVAAQASVPFRVSDLGVEGVASDRSAIRASAC